MATDFIDKIATPNSVFGTICLTASGVALNVGDRTTQIIAGVIAFMAGYAFVYTTVSREEVVKKSKLKELPLDDELTPRKVLEPTEKLGESDAVDEPASPPSIKTLEQSERDYSQSFGQGFTIRKKKP